MFELQNVFKSSLKLQEYLAILPYSQRVWMARFRCKNHKLPIEAGCRHVVLRENRICTHCNMEVGDEFDHFFKCYHFNDIRKRLLNLISCTEQSQVRVVNECAARSRIRKPMYIREKYKTFN